MDVKTAYESIDELRELSPQVHRLTGYDLVKIEESPGHAMVFRQEPLDRGSLALRISLSDAPLLIRMAKEILETLDPSPTQEILATLRRIEARLQETEQQ